MEVDFYRQTPGAFFLPIAYASRFPCSQSEGSTSPYVAKSGMIRSD